MFTGADEARIGVSVAKSTVCVLLFTLVGLCTSRGVKTPKGQHLGVPRVWLVCDNMCIWSGASAVVGAAGMSDPSQAVLVGLVCGIGAGGKLNLSRYTARV